MLTNIFNTKVTVNKNIVCIKTVSNIGNDCYNYSLLIFTNQVRKCGITSIWYKNKLNNLNIDCELSELFFVSSSGLYTVKVRYLKEDYAGDEVYRYQIFTNGWCVNGKVGTAFMPYLDGSELFAKAFRLADHHHMSCLWLRWRSYGRKTICLSIVVLSRFLVIADLTDMVHIIWGLPEVLSVDKLVADANSLREGWWKWLLGGMVIHKWWMCLLACM